MKSIGSLGSPNWRISTPRAVSQRRGILPVPARQKVAETGKTGCFLRVFLRGLPIPLGWRAAALRLNGLAATRQRSEFLPSRPGLTDRL